MIFCVPYLVNNAADLILTAGAHGDNPGALSPGYLLKLSSSLNSSKNVA